MAWFFEHLRPEPTVYVYLLNLHSGPTSTIIRRDQELANGGSVNALAVCGSLYAYAYLGNYDVISKIRLRPPIDSLPLEEQSYQILS